MVPKWFENAKLGIFIHWGIYAVNSTMESWAFTYPNMSTDDYMKQLDGFTASKYDPEEWAELFAKAGARYAVLTTMHHDGVALWDSSAHWPLNVVNDTPAGRDLVGPYADALREKGIKVGFYLSHAIWSMDEYLSVICDRPIEEIREMRHHKSSYVDLWREVLQRPAEEITITPEKSQYWDKFMKVYTGLVDELFTRFGQADVFWGDGMMELPGLSWKKREIHDKLKKINPEMIITRLPGWSDLETPEVRMPCGPVSAGPWEYCVPIDNHWGYRGNEKEYKTPGQVIRLFCDILTMGGTLLLNVGPKEDGTIVPEEREVLLKVGEFIRKNEEAVYETRRGLEWQFYGQGSTLSQDKKTLYLFVHDAPRAGVMVRGVDTPIRKASILSTGEELDVKYNFSRGYGCMWIGMEEKQMDPQMPTVIKVEFEEPCRAESKWGILWENEEDYKDKVGLK